MNIQLREKQRQAILTSARIVILNNPKSKVKAQEIAKGANIARTSLYEHFTSINELKRELLISELMDFREEIRERLSNLTQSSEIVKEWITLNLSYFLNGRHALVCALMPSAIEPYWKAEIKNEHTKLYEELRLSLSSAGYELSPVRFELITAVLETAAKRIESSSTPEQVKLEAINFISKALA